MHTSIISITQSRARTTCFVPGSLCRKIDKHNKKDLIVDLFLDLIRKTVSFPGIKMLKSTINQNQIGVQFTLSSVFTRKIFSFTSPKQKCTNLALIHDSSIDLPEKEKKNDSQWVPRSA